jgi:hypothetical protein
MRRIHEELWVHEQRVLGIDDGLRMTITTLDDGGLWVHSPTPLTAAVREAVDQLGPVRHVIAPNNHHHKSLRDWHEAYPTAQLHVSEGIPRKEPWLREYQLLTATSGDAWHGAVRSQPISGTPFFSETAFFHPQSASLIVSDFVQNHSASQTQTLGLRVTRALFSMLGFRGVCTAPPLALPWVRKDPALFRASIESILAWDFDRIVICHGAIVETRGREILRQLCARWL